MSDQQKSMGFVRIRYLASLLIIAVTFVIFLSNRNHPDESGNVGVLRAKLGTLAAEAIRDFNFASVPGALGTAPEALLSLFPLTVFVSIRQASERKLVFSFLMDWPGILNALGGIWSGYVQLGNFQNIFHETNIFLG